LPHLALDSLELAEEAKQVAITREQTAQNEQQNSKSKRGAEAIADNACR